MEWVLGLLCNSCLAVVLLLTSVLVDFPFYPCPFSKACRKKNKTFLNDQECTHTRTHKVRER